MGTDWIKGTEKKAKEHLLRHKTDPSHVKGAQNTFDYEDSGYQQANLVKLSILLNGQEVEELATVVHQDKARESGKAVCNKLKESIPRQLYEVAIQAAIRSRDLPGRMSGHSGKMFLPNVTEVTSPGR
nr:translation factor GUF1, mitochondrial-like [Lytechinus pictus]